LTGELTRLFNSFSEVPQAAEESVINYNEYRTQESLGDEPPAVF
jgi:hypothetical protein